VRFAAEIGFGLLSGLGLLLCFVYALTGAEAAIIFEAAGLCAVSGMVALWLSGEPNE
jgi:hypothetical protein